MQQKIKDRFVIGKISFLGEWDWTKKEKCIVCGLPLKDGDDKFYCPHCMNAAHKNHIIEWIKLKGNCPLCRKNINISDFES